MKQKLGATGNFPEGKLTKDDQGELAIGLSVDQGKLVINFGKPVHWLAFGPQKAIEFANAIIEAARRIENAS